MGYSKDRVEKANVAHKWEELHKKFVVLYNYYMFRSNIFFSNHEMIMW